MLRTRDRSLLLEALRPPAGYALDRAVGTSYTLDLAALLAAPLAFTFFNYQDEEGEPTRDPVALVEALRRHAEHITLFCQAGKIAVPRPQLTLLGYLEGSVVEVTPPAEGGVFHPKMWLLRFTADEGPVRFRFLCLSRNLTFDRAWDTCLALDGELTRSERGLERNRPLAELVRVLPGLAIRPVPEAVRGAVERLAEEVLRVRFEVPAPFDELAFHPLGLEKGPSWPLPEGTRALVASPFLSESTVRRLRREQGLSVLISRRDALDALPDGLPEDVEAYVLSPSARLDAREAEGEGKEKAAEDSVETEEPAPELTGLHAKLFLVEEGSRAHLFVGSANATRAAFERNVELLVELLGRKGTCGIEVLLGGEDDKIQDSLRSLLQSYERRLREAPDPVQEQLERAAEALAREIGACELSAHVFKIEKDGPYDLELRGRLPAFPDEAKVAVWPASLSSELGRAPVVEEGSPLARYEGVSFEALTAFWAFEVELRRAGQSAQERFVVRVPLCGAPEDRHERLLRSFLKDRRQVLRLLLLLLSEDALDVSLLVEGEAGDSEASFWRRVAGWDEPTLLEALLRSLVDDPKRLEQAARLIDDLSRTPEGRELLPLDLEEIWAPVRQVWKGAHG